MRLEKRWQQPPQHAGQRRHDQNDDKEQPVLQNRPQINHDRSCRGAADQNLSFAAQIPELHLERGRKADRNDEECHHFADCDPGSPAAADRAADYAGINRHRILSRNADNDKRADNQRKGSRDQTDRPRLRL